MCAVKASSFFFCFGNVCVSCVRRLRHVCGPVEVASCAVCCEAPWKPATVEFGVEVLSFSDARVERVCGPVLRPNVGYVPVCLGALSLGWTTPFMFL